MNTYTEMMAESEARVARLQEAHSRALDAEVARNPCCREYNADGALRAREYGFEWEPGLCFQHREWQRISWMLHKGARGMSRGEVGEA